VFSDRGFRTVRSSFEETSLQAYYLAQLRFSELDGTGIEASDIYPGMQVETFIQTGERTLIEYLVRPIRNSFRRAFREAEL
jgi:multidrug efflux pump subunit AcrA (membrane-fusion protein)